MRMTVTVEVDHAILDDDDLIRRDIADKLTSIADLIRNGRTSRGPVNWRLGAKLDGEQIIARWRVGG